MEKLVRDNPTLHTIISGLGLAVAIDVALRENHAVEFVAPTS